MTKLSKKARRSAMIRDLINNYGWSIADATALAHFEFPDTRSEFKLPTTKNTRSNTNVVQ